MPGGVNSHSFSSPNRITPAPCGEAEPAGVTLDRLATRTANLPSAVCSSPSNPMRTFSMGSAASTAKPPWEISTSRTCHADEASFNLAFCRDPGRA